MSTTEEYRFYTDSPGNLLSGADWEKINSRKGGSVKADLPEGWPSHLDGPLVWTGEELLKNEDKFLYTFSKQDLEEIDQAIKNYSLESLTKISKETFPLPKLGPLLENFAKDIYFGSGVRILRGFDKDKYSKREYTIAFLGISSYIGDIRDAQGLSRALTHIKSIAHIPREKRAPIGVSQQTTDPQMFHNDFGGDIVSLFVSDLPLRGGQSLVTSGYTIYNKLAKTRPDLIKLLATKSWKFRGAKENGNSLISYVDGRFFTHFSTRSFIGFREIPRDTDYPELTEEQKEALGAYHWTGFKNALIHTLQKGDIEYVNNLFLQHSRLGYEEDETHRRHVSRLWLRNSKLSALINKPDYITERLGKHFPTDYEQEIPLDEFEEDKIKLKHEANTVDKMYAPPEKK